MGSMNGQIALVTGASRGIGRAAALRIGAQGAMVAVHYVNSRDAADEVVALIGKSGGSAFAVQADLADPKAPWRLFEAMDAELQRRTGDVKFDILVNNAGTGRRAVIEDVSEEDFDRMMNVDLRAPFFLIKLASPRLRDGGRIINVSSMGTRAAYAEMAAYSPFKAGLEALTVLLAQHLGPRGITVNAVLPGATATDMHPLAKDPEMAKTVANAIALGRVGQPEDVADVIAFLASDAGRWVTAQRIEASGGQRL